jgi:hypothetical protein
LFGRFKYLVIAAVTVALVSVIYTLNRPRAVVAPFVDEPSQPVVENIETIGPPALCESVSQLRSERGPDGVTVYWCEA